MFKILQIFYITMSCILCSQSFGCMPNHSKDDDLPHSANTSPIHHPCEGIIPLERTSLSPIAEGFNARSAPGLPDDEHNDASFLILEGQSKGSTAPGSRSPSSLTGYTEDSNASTAVTPAMQGSTPPVLSPAHHPVGRGSIPVSPDKQLPLLPPNLLPPAHSYGARNALDETINSDASRPAIDDTPPVSAMPTPTIPSNYNPQHTRAAIQLHSPSIPRKKPARFIPYGSPTPFDVSPNFCPREENSEFTTPKPQDAGASPDHASPDHKYFDTSHEFSTSTTNLPQRLELEKWLLFCAASYLAYPPCNEKFKKPARPPAEYLNDHGYGHKRLSPYVTVCKNENGKDAIFAIRGTSCAYTFMTTLASFSYWGEKEYNETLQHFFPKFLSKPYSAAIYTSMLLATASYAFAGWSTYTQQYTTFSYILLAATTSVFLILKKNLFPSFFGSIYFRYVSHALDVIEEEKRKLVEQGFTKFTVTGHSLGGHVAQFVAAFDPTLEVFSISAIGGAYPHACSTQGWFTRLGKNRKLEDEASWKTQLEGLIGENDSVVGLSYDGDMKQTRVGEGDEDPLSAHRLASIYRALFARYADECIRALQNLSHQASPAPRPMVQADLSPAMFPPPLRSVSESPPPSIDTNSETSTPRTKISWWKIWQWGRKDSIPSTLPMNTSARKSMWNLYGLLGRNTPDITGVGVN
jgi:hypothetical protein